MADYSEHSAYPHPSEFEVMRPEYHELDDGFVQATIVVSPFKVTGRSSSRPGARRAALYEAEKTYRSYHPHYPVPNPYPETFTDREGQQWFAVPRHQRRDYGDYRFVDEYDEEDYADIETMLMWDIRPADTPKTEAEGVA